MWYGIVTRFVGPPTFRFELFTDIRFFDREPTEDEVMQLSTIAAFMESYEDGTDLQEALDDSDTSIEELMRRDYIDSRNVIVQIGQVPDGTNESTMPSYTRITEKEWGLWLGKKNE